MIELFAVQDAVADAFVEPFCGPTVAFALRGFEEACQNEEGQFFKFPLDYALFHIGTFDSHLGVLVGFDVPRKIGQASSFVVNTTTLQAAEPIQDHGVIEEIALS